MSYRHVAALFLFASITGAAHAADPARDAWRDREVSSLDDASVQPRTYRALTLDVDAVRAHLARDGAVLSLPTPEGDALDFTLVDSGTMSPGLAAQFPDFRSLRGRDAAGNAVRVDVNALGVQAMVFEHDGGRFVVQPEKIGADTDAYLSFRRDAIASAPRQCAAHPSAKHAAVARAWTPPREATTTGNDRRVLRAVVAATGEYTQFFGGSVAQGQAAIVTAVNRINEIYERDLSTRLQLVANNNLVVYANAITDPYTNDDGELMLDENQTNLDLVIGPANYDIGHVFSTGGGGIAALGVLCASGAKAQGVTGLSAPVGDPFYVDFVAHELGHQFGGDHTFNSTMSFCGGGNRDGISAYEPGSGSTIMAYAGICGSDDLQPNSDPYFHAQSLAQMQAELTSVPGCGTSTVNPNQTPVIPAFPTTATAIPSRTPILLESPTATDADGDALTYAWEQFNRGNASAVDVDSGTNAIIRSFNPSASRQRIIPRLSNLLANTTVKGELLPQVNRTALTFRLTVRDNHAGGGKTVSADLPPMQVVGAAGPFRVTSPDTAVTWGFGTTQAVTWDVAGTTAAPISCASVDIALSTDGGNTFATTLATATPNDGSAPVTVPATASTTARIRVKCATNIFFDVSNANFTISASAPVDAIFQNSFE